MRDLIERLRAPAYWMSGSSEYHEGENNAPREAADEIERLRAENARLLEYYRASEAMVAIEHEWRSRKANGGLLDGPSIFNLTEKLTSVEARLHTARAILAAADAAGGE